MRKNFFIIVFISIPLLFVNSQIKGLTYNNDGKFKILQITDTHYIQGNPKSDVVIDLLNEVIENEKPDLLVFTGDMVWKNTETRKALDELFEPVIAKKIPWAYVFGNHDDEADMTREEIMNYVKKKPYCLATQGPKGVTGVGNYTLEIQSSTNKKPQTILYCMDSNAYSKLEGIKGYGWLAFDQIEWYQKVSKGYTKRNNNKTIPSLAFFHIPLFEYTEVSADVQSLVGTRKEKECNPKLNTGMFSAMRQNGDIMGVFTGHDHDNDYIGVLHNIALAYGRYSGGNTVYNHLGKNGCRVIELQEGEKSFTTYIYLLGGEKINHYKYTSSY